MSASLVQPGSSTRPDVFVEIQNLSVDFRLARTRARRATLRAVDDVSLTINKGETVALVGESGSGKTTLARTLVRLYEPTSGTVTVDNVDVSRLTGSALREIQRRTQLIFQDPYASLNPRMKVGDIIAEPMRAHNVGDATERRARVRDLLERVGLSPEATDRFPNAFSGGQRQRIGIARALALEPDLIVADEPVSALDVSIQAQILNLLLDLQEELGLTMLFISHDLAVVRSVAHRVAVLYLGKIVEVAPRDEIFESPQHPYTQALLAAVPEPDPVLEHAREPIVLHGEPPSPVNPPSGCRFHTRCPYAMAECRSLEPALLPSRSAHVACHLVHPPQGAFEGSSTT